ncbi:ATP-binding cassette domain-containing protein [Flammeovirgaceae bacterium SG7u.111]|nr:ATP-binding cassette domain-containing protein [Flammeovirgaceae bacterium SG7u.132]WPO36144.1 ATP-binding cassette domain-containing protein [Flammeovirgaceae bacterium SG7u.111]
MNNKQLKQIASKIAELIKHEYKAENLTDVFNQHFEIEDHRDFLHRLSDFSQKIDLAIVKHTIAQEQLERFVRASNYPILSFCLYEGAICPVLMDGSKPGFKRIYLFTQNGVIETDDLKPILEIIYTDGEGQVTYAIPYSLHSMVSENDNQEKKSNTPVSRLFNLLGAEKKDIFYIYFYAIITSLIGLSLPLGIQAIIGLITGGVIFNSIVLLIAIVIGGVIIVGALQVMQYTIVEILQRRIFVKAALEFTFRLPKIRNEALQNYYPPELMNRFFDVLTIQKGLPKLLIDITGSGLQIFFGLLLLSLYHPFFVFFGIFTILTLTVVLYITGPKGLKSSLVESKYKYKVVHWLEELARTLYSFKLAGHTSLPMQKMDSYVNNYLHYRKKHFRVLMIQYINFVGFKTIITGGLLIIGSWLVIDRQITLGQFVATELVIVLVMNAVEKLIVSMADIYDVLTAVEKIGYVTDMDLEKNGGINVSKEKGCKGMDISIKNLTYQYNGSKSTSINNLDLHIPAGQRICISGFNDSGKNTLVSILTGVLDNFKGYLSLNDISIRDMNLSSLRDNIAKNVSEEELFDGSIYDNITMGKSNVSYEDVTWALRNLGLLDKINAMPEGLMTEIVAGGKGLSGSTTTKLILARCIVDRPQMLILNDVLFKLEKKDRLNVLGFMVDHSNPWTLVCVSNDPVVMSACDRVIILNEGKTMADGSYDSLMENEHFKDLLIYPYKQELN